MRLLTALVLTLLPAVSFAQAVPAAKPQAEPSPSRQQTPQELYEERARLHSFDRHVPLPTAPAASRIPPPYATGNSPAASLTETAHFRDNRNGWGAESIIFVPAPLYAPPPALYALPGAPPPITGATRSQEIFFTAISRVHPDPGSLWLTGTGVMTFDDRTGYQFQPVTGDNLEVRVNSPDGSFLNSCLITAQSSIPPGYQLAISGVGSYSGQQVTQDRVLWTFNITQPLQCALLPQLQGPPPGNYPNYPGR